MKAILLLTAVLTVSCYGIAVAEEKTKSAVEPTGSVDTSRGFLDCSTATVINGNVTLTGEDNFGWPNNVMHYSCVSWTEAGGERVYELTVEANTRIIVSLNIISGGPDVFLLGSCNDADCLTVGEDGFSYLAVEGGVYYIVVDGHVDAPECVYDLSVACEEALPPPANDNCDGAIDLQEQGLPEFVVDLCDYTNQYDPGVDGCTGYRALGPEAVYKIDLVENELFEACVESIEEFTDMSLYLITDCEDPVGSCVVGSDALWPPPAIECISYTATETGIYYLMVDSYLNCGAGVVEVTFDTCLGSPSGLVGFYPFHGSAIDQSGSGNDGEIHGAILTSDRFGNPDSAFMFDGIDDYIEIPLGLCNDLAMDTNSFSVSCWLKTSMVPTNPTVVVGNYRPYTTPHWTLGLNPNNPEEIIRCGFGMRDQNSNIAGVTTEGAVNDGYWHHFVGVRNVEQGIIEFWCDGQLIGVDDDVPGSVNSGQSIWIGVHLSRYFEGVIDDIRIYRRALTAEEALDLYTAPNPSSVDDDLPNRPIPLNCYPNPFNPQTTISFSLPSDDLVKIGVYDLTGRLLGVLADRAYNAGDHSVIWNGKDTMGRAMPSGSYIVRLKTKSGVEARKVSLIR